MALDALEAEAVADRSKPKRKTLFSRLNPFSRSRSKKTPAQQSPAQSQRQKSAASPSTNDTARTADDYDDNDTSYEGLMLSDGESTLIDPSTKGGMFLRDQSLAGFISGSGDDNQSLSTLGNDGDYSRAMYMHGMHNVGAYGGGREGVGGGDGATVSSAGVTLQGYATDATSAYLDASVTDDDLTFFTYDRPDGRQQQKIIHVTAPPGKLGLSIDTPDTCSYPIVHAVKDSSPLVNDLEAGDVLIAIDDTDVRFYTAIQVSKVLSKRSGHQERRLTVLRTNALGDDMEED